MERKLNAKLLTLFLLIGTLICAVFASLAVMAFNYESADKSIASEDTQTTISAPDLEAEPAVSITTYEMSSARINYEVLYGGYEYTGSEIEPKPGATHGGFGSLTEGTHFTYSYANNINAGTATITLTGCGQFIGSISTTFTINPKDATKIWAVRGESLLGNNVYTGSALTPKPTVIRNGYGPVDSAYYDLTYSNNVNAGSATVVVTAKGNYTGTWTLGFTIYPKSVEDIWELRWEGTDVSNLVYTGSAITPKPYVYRGGYGSVNSSNYDMSYSNNVNAGPATVTVTGKGNYTGSVSTTFTIKKATYNMSNAKWNYTSAFTYDGKAKTVSVTGLPSGVTATYSNNSKTNAGDYKASATLSYDTTNYNAPSSISDLSWKINRATYNMSNAKWNYTSAFTYDGTAKTVSVTGLPSGVTATYSNNSKTNADTYTASATLSYDTTNYNKPTIANLSWTINPASITGGVVTLGTTSFIYDGSAKMPSITKVVTTGNLNPSSSDYTVSYSGNINVGTATVIITGKGNYTDTASTTFTVEKAPITNATVTLDINSFTYDGNAKKPNVLSVVMDKTLSSSTDYTVSYSNNVNAGNTATVTITATSASTNYTGTATKTFTIDKATPTLTASVVDGIYYIGRELSTVGIECDNPDGEIAWTTGSTILTASGTYGWTFVPADTLNWNDVTGNLPVTAVAELDGISVAGIGTYTAYDSFTTSGLTITAHYLGGVADVTVSADDCTITIPYADGNTYFLVADSGSSIAFEYSESGITVNTEVEITVIKADYDLRNVRMDSVTEPYNKQEKSITIAGTLPTGLNGGKSGLEVLYYTYNLTRATGRTNFGEYEVVAVLNNLDEANYNTPELKATLTITKATPKVTVIVATGTYFVGDLLGDIGITYDESQTDTNGTVSWTNGTLTLTDGGNYGWTFVPDDTANYNNATGFESVKVSFRVVSIRVYNAITNYSAYDEFDPTGMVVEATYAAGKTPTSVEGWTFSYPGSTKYFLVADDGKSMTVYYSEGGNDVTTTVEIHVVKKTVDMSEVEMEDKEETYNGSPWSITAENLPDGVQVDHYTYNDETSTGVKDADTYTVVAVFKVTDTANVEVPANKTAQLIINRAEAEFDTDELQTVYTYSGETITIDSGVNANNTEQTVNYTDNEFKYVSDSGKLILSVEQSKNYNAKTIEIDITIEQAQLSLTWNGEEAPYDGKVHSAVLEVAGAVGEDIGVITTENFGALITVNYTGPDTERKKAGVYTPGLTAFPEVSPYDNYSYVITNPDYTLKILDGLLNITFTSDSVVYDGENHELLAQDVPDEVQVTYYYKNTTDLFTGVKDVHYVSGVVAGYEITAKFACSTGNYTAPDDMHATLTITPREISEDEVGGILETYTYKGSAWTPAPVVTLQLVEDGDIKTLTKGEDYTVSYSTDEFNAGTEVTVQVKGSGNYGGKIEIPFTIVKALLGLEWQEGEYTYNGASQGITATLTGVAEVDKDAVTLTHAYEGVGDTHYSGTDLPVNSGDYLVTVSLGELANYETFSSRSRNFKIKKADVQVKVIWESYDESVDELYEGSSVPTLKLDGTPKLGDIEVTGSLVCQHTALIFGENEYIWIFTPNDTENLNTVYVKKILNAMNAKISAIHVGWRDGTMPSIYVSTTLDEIRDYLEITCDLTGRTDTITLDKSAEYTISGNWENSGDAPKFGNAPYVLTVRYNGKVDTIDAYYIALDYSLKVDKVEGFKADYKGLDEFDRTNIKVTAVRNDGAEEVVTDYIIKYVSGDALWVGDTYITISYDANGTLEKPIEREVNGLRVTPKDYDISGIYFPESSIAEYDGTGKAYAITGVFEDGEVSYTYAKRNSSGVFESCTADDLTDVGTYRITARFTLKGEANLANYNKIDPISSELRITPADCAEIIGLTDVTVDYDNGNSLAEKVHITNLPDGVTGVNYAYTKNGTHVSENEVVDAGEYVVTVSFEVDANHNAIMPRTVKLVINKVEPNVSQPVVSGSLSAGTKLGDLFFDELDGVKGTFVWDNADQVLKAGMNRCAYTFTPDDTTNYKVVKGYLDLTISGSSASEGQGGTKNASSSTALIIVMSVALVLVLVIAIAALKIAVSGRKAIGGDSDGFYDDVTPDDLN